MSEANSAPTGWIGFGALIALFPQDSFFGADKGHQSTLLFDGTDLGVQAEGF